MKKIEHNAQTGEIIEIEMTQEEIDAWNERQAKDAEVFNNARQAKQAAEAKLAALGLTADDLKALGL